MQEASRGSAGICQSRCTSPASVSTHIHREVGKDCSVSGSLASNSGGSRRLRRAALPSRLLLPMHTNGLASHPRQPLLLLSPPSSHTRLSLRSTCSPHSRHAHATEPLSTRACCLRVSAHTDTYTCLVLTPQPPPNRTSASPLPNTFEAP